MEKDKVEQFIKELSDKGKLAEPKKKGFFSKVFGGKEEPSDLPLPPKPTMDMKIKSELEKAVKRIDALDRKFTRQKSTPNKEVEESFARALGKVDKEKVEAKAIVPNQAVIVPTGRVQEFLDKMKKYGVKVEQVEMVDILSKPD